MHFACLLYWCYECDGKNIGHWSTNILVYIFYVIFVVKYQAREYYVCFGDTVNVSVSVYACLADISWSVNVWT